MILLINEIKKKEEELKQIAGIREKFFYSYLTSKNIHDIEEIPVEDIDKICYVVFTNNESVDISKDIEKAIKSQPISGIHFSSNLIALIAYSIKSVDIKRKYLYDLYQISSYSDKFLISICFEDFRLPTENSPKSVFDELIKCVFIEKDFDKAENLIYQAFENVTDLKELYIVRKVYEEVLKKHPNTKLEEKYISLSKEINQLIKNVKKNINQSINILIIAIGIVIVPLGAYFTKKYWDKYSLEPIVTSTSIIIPILATMFIAIFNWQPNNALKRIILKLKNKLLKRWFKKRGVNIDEISNLLEN